MSDKNRTKYKKSVEPITTNNQEPQAYTKLSPNLSSPQTTAQITDPPTNTDINHQIIEDLKEQRDTLRGINTLGFKVRSKKSKLKILLIIISTVLSLVLIYIFLIKPNLNSTELDTTSTTQQNFVLPSNLSSKTSEEQQALKIIDLARQNKADDIISTYLNKAQIGQSEEGFKNLISSYAQSADGQQVELIEKKIGKVDFNQDQETTLEPITTTTSEFDAASLIYKSAYFRHTNYIYLKINLYKPDPTVDSWKLYTFEFKTGEDQSPLKADVNVPL